MLCLLGALAPGAVACSRSNAANDGPAPGPSADAQLIAEPEPAAAGFKALPAGCGEPVVRILSSPHKQFDSARAADLVVSFVRDNPEFGVDGIHYAEADVSGQRMLLARTPDADTANRIARRLHEKDKSSTAVPMCGYASSGWTHAVRRVPRQ